jgi:hypothetical protein
LRLKGVCYDVGAVMGFNWRPVFDPKVVHRELEIIKNDLHCNTVSISALDVGRVVTAATAALEEGLEVWLSPLLWDKSENETVAYLAKAAGPLEALRKQWPDKVVLSVAAESTLFMQGILEGKNIIQRLGNPKFRARIMAGEHNAPLNAFLARAVAAVRKEFKGKLTYHSLIWEKVDWNLFDYVGVDHYRAKDIEDKYVQMLKPLFDSGKPVVVTEFGHNTYQSDGKLAQVLLGGGDVDFWSQFFHYLPVVGRFVRPKVRVIHPRDEAWQARKVVETLEILDSAGVDGAFVSQFESQINPFDEDPKYDLDTPSSSLVKYYEHGRHGATYPDMPWEPKESFRALADYYAEHR